MTYVGEEAVDYGGPRQEFWQLLVQKGRQQYCVGGAAVLLLFKTLQLFRFDIVICLRLLFSEEI